MLTKNCASVFKINFLNKVLFPLTVICLTFIITFIFSNTTMANTSVFNLTEFERSRVTDSAALLNETDLSSLLTKINSILEKYSFDTVIVTQEMLDGKTAEAFADDFFDRGGYGYGPDADGILLLVSMTEREWHISTSGSGIRFFSDQQIDSISNKLIPYFRSGDYATAFSVFLDEVIYVIEYINVNGVNPNVNVYPRKEINKSVTFIYIILGALAAALICVLIMKYQMNTSRSKTFANDYIKGGSFKLTRQKDIFLYSHTSRRLKPQNTSSTGHSSATHTSSSGHTHGGHGGKF